MFSSFADTIVGDFADTIFVMDVESSAIVWALHKLMAKAVLFCYKE